MCQQVMSLTKPQPPVMQCSGRAGHMKVFLILPEDASTSTKRDDEYLASQVLTRVVTACQRDVAPAYYVRCLQWQPSVGGMMYSKTVDIEVQEWVMPYPIPFSSLPEMIPANRRTTMN